LLKLRSASSSNLRRILTIFIFDYLHIFEGAVVDLQLSMQSVPITTDFVSSNLDQGEVYNIMW